MKVAIIGHGYVGLAMYRVFMRAHEIRVYDPKYPDDHRSDWGNIKNVQGCDLAVICVPTPANEDGSCDTRLVREAISQIDAPLFLIKSTVAPGFTDWANGYRGNVAFSPEYIGSEPTWPALNGDPDPTDAARHGWCTLGGPPSVTSRLVDILMPCLGPGTRFIQCSGLEAELAKYMENAFLATKVTFCNEWAGIAKLYGVDYNRLREVWLADPRIGRSHTAVFPENPGWGGRCLPKDMKAIMAEVHKLADPYVPTLLEAVKILNDVHRSPVRQSAT